MKKILSFLIFLLLSAPACGGVVTTGTATVLPVVKNNIFYGYASGTRYGYLDDSALTETDETLNYNLFYSNTAATSGVASGVCDGSGDSCLTNNDPLFVNPASGDFKISSSSPAKDTGAVLYTYAAHPGDYYGRKIYGAGPDIGAVEYEDHTPGGWFFEFFIPTIFNLCASTNTNCYTQP